MLDVNKIRSILTGGSKDERLDILECLKDQFDSFDKNIEHFEEIIYVLIDASIAEHDIEVKVEVFEALTKAAVFQDIESINFDKLVDNLKKIPEECLGRCIDVLSFSHKLCYLSTIKGYLNHTNPYVRESAEYAVKEILG